MNKPISIYSIACAAQYVRCEGSGNSEKVIAVMRRMAEIDPEAYRDLPGWPDKALEIPGLGVMEF
jgi:hypothetical protein